HVIEPALPILPSQSHTSDPRRPPAPNPLSHAETQLLKQQRPSLRETSELLEASHPEHSRGKHMSFEPGGS
ncbi:hypothetical protein, partial [Mycobacterium nebraskense]|uniref:hypothetical protein n=1 Tax=Mycobacterium nebraskense TaxID=244292 RepID=UPI001E2D9356